MSCVYGLDYSPIYCGNSQVQTIDVYREVTPQLIQIPSFAGPPDLLPVILHFHTPLRTPTSLDWALSLFNSVYLLTSDSRWLRVVRQLLIISPRTSSCWSAS